MSSPSKLRAAILIISETASRDPSTDKCIPALQDVFTESGGDQWSADETSIVTDNVLDIQRVITQYTDSKTPINLIVTSGGTGFTQKDVTPEVSMVPRCLVSYCLCHAGFSVPMFKFAKHWEIVDGNFNSGSCAITPQTSVWLGPHNAGDISGGYAL